MEEWIQRQETCTPVLCPATELHAALPLSKNKIGIQIFPAGQAFYRKSRAIKAEEHFAIVLLSNCSSNPGAPNY